MIEFRIPAVPVAQPRQRTRVVQMAGRAIAANYTPTRHPVNAFKAACQHAASLVWQGPPTDGPVSLWLTFVLPRSKAKVWKSRPMPRYPHIITPDFDNLAKSVTDALTGLCWRDDSLIYRAVIEKFVASGDEQPHVVVRIATDTDPCLFCEQDNLRVTCERCNQERAYVPERV